MADGAQKETVTLTAADNWTHTFSNLPKFDTTDGHEIVYTVDEVDVPNYTRVFLEQQLQALQLQIQSQAKYLYQSLRYGWDHKLLLLR